LLYEAAAAMLVSERKLAAGSSMTRLAKLPIRRSKRVGFSQLNNASSVRNAAALSLGRTLICRDFFAEHASICLISQKKMRLRI
jgi:hypothetical protein